MIGKMNINSRTFTPARVPPLLHKGRLVVLTTMRHFTSESLYDSVTEITCDLHEAFLESPIESDISKFTLKEDKTTDVFHVMNDGAYVGSYSAVTHPHPDGKTVMLKVYVREDIYEFYPNDAGLTEGIPRTNARVRDYNLESLPEYR